MLITYSYIKSKIHQKWTTLNSCIIYFLSPYSFLGLFLIVFDWLRKTDGKVNTCQESAEYDEANKKVIFKLFGGDVAKEYKFINLIFEVSDKENGGANIKWTVDYERLSDQVHPPYGYIEYLYKCTVDFDSHLLKP